MMFSCFCACFSAQEGPTNTPAEHLPCVVNELHEKLLPKQGSERSLQSEAMTLFCFEERKAFMLSDYISLLLMCGRVLAV